MELIDAIRQRRSVKHFDAEHRLTEDELRHLLGHAFLAPSSFNMQNWHVVVVDDQAQQEALCEASWHQAQVKDCSVTFILAVISKATRRWRALRAKLQKRCKRCLLVL